jgi:hypothetical protein
LPLGIGHRHNFKIPIHTQTEKVYTYSMKKQETRFIVIRREVLFFAIG